MSTSEADAGQTCNLDAAFCVSEDNDSSLPLETSNVTIGMNRHLAGSDSSIPEDEKSTTPVLFSDSEESDNVHTEDKKSVPSIATIISVSSDELPRSLRNTADTSMDVQIDCDNQRDITDASISDSTLFTDRHNRFMECGDGTSSQMPSFSSSTTGQRPERLTRTMSLSSNNNESNNTSPEIERRPKKRRRTFDRKEIMDGEGATSMDNVKGATAPTIHTLDDIGKTVDANLFQQLLGDHSLPSTSSGRRTKKSSQKKVSNHTLDWLQNSTPLPLDIYQNELSRDSSASVYATAGSSRTDSPEFSRRQDAGIDPAFGGSSSDLDLEYEDQRMIDNDFPVRSSSFAGRPQPQLSIECTPPVTERSMPFAEISRGLGSGSSSPDLRSSDISRHYKNKQRMSRERSIREAAEQRQTERIHQLSVSPTPTSPEFPSAHTSQRSRRGKNKKTPYKKHRDKTKYKHSHRHMDFSDTDSSLDDGLESRPTAQGMESDSSSSVDFASNIFRKRNRRDAGRKASQRRLAERAATNSVTRTSCKFQSTAARQLDSPDSTHVNTVSDYYSDDWSMVGSPSDIEQAIMRNSCGIDGLDLSPAPPMESTVKSETPRRQNIAQPQDYINIDSDDDDDELLFVTPNRAVARKVASQMEKDAAFARQLQEQMDKEYADSLQREPSGPLFPTGSTPPIHRSLSLPPTLPDDLNTTTELLAQMADSDGSGGEMVSDGAAGDSDLVAEDGSNDEVDHYRGASHSHPPPPTFTGVPAPRRHNFSALTDYEWSVHLAIIDDEDIPTAPDGENRDLHEILQNDLLEALTHMPAEERRRLQHRRSRDQARADRRHRHSTTAPVTHDPEYANPDGLVEVQSPMRLRPRTHVGRQNSSVVRIPRRPRRTENPHPTDEPRHRHGHHCPYATSHLVHMPPETRFGDLVQFIHFHPAAAGAYNQWGRYEHPEPPVHNSPFGHRRMIFDQSFDARGNDYEALLRLDEDGGRSQGLTKEQISRLPTRVFKSSTGKDTTKSKNRKRRSKNADNLDTTNSEEPSGSAKVDGSDCAKGVEVKDTMKECHICMSEFVNNEKLRILTCFHEFHTKCIDKWIKTNPTCPVCRAQVEI